MYNLNKIKSFIVGVRNRHMGFIARAKCDTIAMKVKIA
ncbi:hypothetical protein QB910_000117 [Dabrowskivirus KKP3916]|uniref:Transposase n=1 Tax=Alicyclobacillus phage KKP_3916 TaxID=3040651 RepID=A0AAT9V7S2_9CAUD|nr:hypothetical protein QB910_000117 [Alicyclobacillus phage KKP 3916]